MAIVRTAEVFKRTNTGVFRNYGISFPQYNVLRVLEASKNGQNKISDVGRIMLVPSANMTGLSKSLEKGGSIIRKSDPADERITMLKIYPQGETLKHIEADKDQWLDLMLKNFSNQEKLNLLDKVKRILKNGIVFNENIDR